MSEGERSREEAVMTHDGMTTLVMAWPGRGSERESRPWSLVWYGRATRNDLHVCLSLFILIKKKGTRDLTLQVQGF